MAATTPSAPPPAPRDDTHRHRHTARGTGRVAAILLIVLLVGAGVGGIAYVALRRPAATDPAAAPPSAPAAPGRASPAAPPPVRFTDVTAAAGIDFVHENGAYGDKLLPETMGGGVAFFDYDADGDPDLLFVNGMTWPHKATASSPKSTARLYRNDGTGKFHDATAGSGLDVPFYGMGVACGDYDNDGDADVFLTGVGGYKLFLNDSAGKFSDVTARAGAGGSADDWGTGAAFVDYDNDGLLDLFVCNYVRWSPELDRAANYTLAGVGRAYGPPTNFQGAFCRLYHNDGGGRFSDVSENAGVRVTHAATGAPAGKSLGVAPVDVDRDGFIDLVVTNDTVQNFVFHNQRDGTFKESGVDSGVAFDAYGNARGAMGVDAAYFRNTEEPALGIAIGNFANEMTALYVAQGEPASMLFTDEAINEGIGAPSRAPLKFGTMFFDYDLDGWEDLLTANGHLEEHIGKVQPGQSYKQPAQLFWNAGGKGAGGFVEVSAEKSGPDLFKPVVGRGSAVADVDGDGDLDVVITQIAGAPLLLRNDQALQRPFIRLKLEGAGANRDAVGARVKVRAGPHTLLRQVMPTRSYLSQSELPVTVGLPAGQAPDSVEVTWPGGKVQAVSGVTLGKTFVVKQVN